MVEVYEFGVTIESYLVRVQITNTGLSRLYVGHELRDTYNPDPLNLWGSYNLFEPGLFALEWRALLSDSIIGADCQQALVEFQIRSGQSGVFWRILCAGKVVKQWKHRRE